MIRKLILLSFLLFIVTTSDTIDSLSIIDIPESGSKITDTDTLVQIVTAAGGNMNTLSLRVPMERIDCNSNSIIDFSFFTKLNTLHLVINDHICLSALKFNDNLNLFLHKSNSSNGRRLESSRSVLEVYFFNQPIAAINLTQDLFNGINRFRVESIRIVDILK